MPTTGERFDSGLTYEQWLAGMTKNKERFVANYDAAQIGAADVAFFKGCKPLKVLVLAEEWCGDAIANVPILAKLAAAVGANLSVRIFKRDENLDIMDQYLYQGQFRSIPAIVFFDGKMKELGCWWERPQIARDEMSEARRRFAEQHPGLADATKPVPEMSDATKQLYMATMAQLRAENTARWTQAVVDEWRKVVGG
jgi:hypothetical protein